MTADPAAEILEEYLARARLRGERTVAFVRVLVATLGAARVLALAVAGEGLLAADWAQLVIATLAVVASLSLGRALRGAPRRAALLWVSVALDAAVVASSVAFVMATDPPAHGFLSSPWPALLVLLASSAAMRFSPPVAVFGGAAAGALLVAMAVFDLVATATEVTTALTAAAVYVLAGAWLAWGLARRGVRLVYEGADAVLRQARATSALGVYVSPEIAAEAVATGAVKLGGERRPVAILFSDLRGFTAYAERLPPEQLIGELNAYLQAMVPAIEAEGGLVDKYIGDAIMAVFGIPTARGDEAARAIRAAAGMHAALVAHNTERAEAGLPPLAQGIGVHVGDVVAGNIGTPAKAQYTVVGDAVNLTSRLESATKERGVATLLSDDVVRAAGGAALPVRDVGELAVRGREQPLRVWTLDG